MLHTTRAHGKSAEILRAITLHLGNRGVDLIEHFSRLLAGDNNQNATVTEQTNQSARVRRVRTKQRAVAEQLIRWVVQVARAHLQTKECARYRQHVPKHEL